MKYSEEVIRNVLEGTATREEAKGVASWFATNEGAAWLRREMHTNPRYADILDEDIPSGDIYRKILQKIERRVRKAKVRRISWIAAASFIPVVLLSFLWIEIKTNVGYSALSSGEIVCEVSPNGEKKEIIFQDGTKIHLNAGSTLHYPEHFAFSSREVTLNGEARFEVATNPHRPFIVNIGNAKVIVKGTTFNIKAFDAEPLAVVSLLEGSIDFSYLDKSIALKPSETLVLNKDSNKIAVGRTNDLVSPDAWIENIISFRDRPAQEILSALARKYNVTFVYDSPAAASCSLSFTSDEISLDKLLQEISMVSSLRFETDSNGIIHVR